MKTAILAIRIIGDATGAAAAMTKAQRAAMTFREKLGKAATVASAALGAIGVGAKQCVDAAADLQQSIGGVETVFGSSSAQMLQWSRNAAQAVGLSQNEYNTFATLVGSQLQNFGMSVDESAVKTNELIGLGADLSSMFGGTTADAVDALSAALKGEMDPIEKYGISLNDATLKAQAASMGLGDLYAAGDRNAKMQATLAAITEQSGKAVGNFAREADTAQGQQQRMAAAFENSKAALGEALLPALTEGAQKLAEFATWVQQNTAWLTPLVAVVTAFAAAIVVANAAWGAYSTVQAIVQAMNLTTAGTFGVLAGATGIGLVIAAIILLATHWNQVKAAGAAAADWMMQKMQALYNMLPPGAQTAVRFVGDAFNLLKAAFTGDHQAMAQAAQAMYNALPGWAQTGIQLAGHWFDFLKNAASGDFDGMKQAAKAMFDLLPGWAKSAADSVVGFFKGMYDSVTGWFSGIGDMISGAVGAVGGLIGKITGAKSAAADISVPQAYALQPSVYRLARTIDMAAPTGLAMRAPALPNASSLYRAGASLARPAAGRTVTVNLTVNASSPIMTPGTAPEVGKEVYKAVRSYFDTYGSKPL